MCCFHEISKFRELELATVMIVPRDGQRKQVVLHCVQRNLQLHSRTVSIRVAIGNLEWKYENKIGRRKNRGTKICSAFIATSA